MDLVTFSRRLKSAAKESGLTQTEIAHQLRTRPQTVQKWFAGKSSPSRGSSGGPSRLEELARVVGVSSAWLAGYTGEDKEPAAPEPRVSTYSTGARGLAELSSHIQELRTQYRRILYDLRLETSHRLASDLEDRGIPVRADDNPFELHAETPERPYSIAIASPEFTSTPEGYRVNVSEEARVVDFFAVPLPDDRLILVPVAALPENPRILLPIRVSNDGSVTMFGTDLTPHVDVVAPLGSIEWQWQAQETHPPRTVSESD